MQGLLRPTTSSPQHHHGWWRYESGQQGLEVDCEQRQGGRAHPGYRRVFREMGKGDSRRMGRRGQAGGGVRIMDRK